jgi:4,5-dihydroxyphthalate decarboxylase
MADLTMSYSGVNYFDRTGPILDGTVKPEGITLQFQPGHPGELFRRVAQTTDLDLAEMSTSTYMNLVSRGDDRYVALPVFLSRNFRHGYIFVARDSGVERPEDLRGKKVAVPEYQMTAALWQRAALQHDYGVLPGELRWFEGGLARPGFLDRNHLPPPPGVSIERIPEDQYLEGLLAAGELDALFTATRPAAFRDGSGRVRRLFPSFVAVEREYYQRTGHFPIMHLAVVRGALFREHRWVAESLTRAFAEAQRIGWGRVTDTGTLAVMLPWLPDYLEQGPPIMGPKDWRYGFRENYATLSAMCEYHHEQGLSNRRLTPEELFPPETHDLHLEA